MRTDTRHYEPRTRLGSQHHRALQMLSLGDACSTALRATCQTGHTLPDLPNFRRRILETLRDRELIESAGRDQWRITHRGTLELQALAGAPEPAQRSAVLAAATGRPEMTRPALPEGIDYQMLTSSPARPMSETDKRPAPVRRDGMQFAEYPSRRGNRLYYRDGRVTDMEGNRLEVGA